MSPELFPFYGIRICHIVQFLFCAVTLQAQREYPPDMQCKDKFLLQSTIVNPNTDVDDLPADTVRGSTLSFIRDQLYRLKSKN